mgnify:CR=1 FL=1
MIFKIIHCRGTRSSRFKMYLSLLCFLRHVKKWIVLRRNKMVCIAQSQCLVHTPYIGNYTGHSNVLWTNYYSAINKTMFNDSSILLYNYTQTERVIVLLILLKTTSCMHVLFYQCKCKSCRSRTTQELLWKRHGVVRATCTGPRHNNSVGSKQHKNTV